MNIRFALPADLIMISKLDKHINKDELLYVINSKRVLVSEESGEFTGWLRFNLFWDNTPFMNMLYVIESYRGKDIGSQLVTCWESKMKSLRYKLLMTSTLANEKAQNFTGN